MWQFKRGSVTHVDYIHTHYTSGFLNALLVYHHVSLWKNIRQQLKWQHYNQNFASLVLFISLHLEPQRQLALTSSLPMTYLSLLACNHRSPNSTWLITSRLDMTRHVWSVEPVELVVSSRAVRQARHSQNAWARHVKRVETCCDEPSGNWARPLFAIQLCHSSCTSCPT